VLTRFGPAFALLVLPVGLAIASGGFALAPTLVFGNLLCVVDNGLSYSIHQSSKESLYVPTRVEEKYRAKAFIDVFVQRLAKALAVGATLVVTTLFTDYQDVRWLTLALLPLLGIWVMAARHAGRTFECIERTSGSTGDARHACDRALVPIHA
jgi:AAA family ATP:ADP antiporter